MSMIYDELLRFSRVYRKGTQDITELANICFLDFMEGNYQKVYESFPDPGKEPFLRKFVKVRCYREMTKTSYAKTVPVEPEKLSYVGDDRTPLVYMEVSSKDNVESDIMGALKEQERIVLDALLDGATRREIAAKIGRSLGTVQNIIERIKMNPAVQALKQKYYEE